MELTQKGEMVSRLQAKASQIGKILNNLEKYNHLISRDKEPPRQTTSKRPTNQFKPFEKPNKLELTSSTSKDGSQIQKLENIPGTDEQKAQNIVDSVQNQSTE